MGSFTPKHVVTIVVAVSLAAVLTPLSVGAATGTIVNIVDPAVVSRQARVASGNTLTVESRAGSVANSFNMKGQRLGNGYINLVSVQAPTRIAVTELTLLAAGPSGFQELLIEAYVRTSGSNPCNGPNTAGYTRHTLRHVLVTNLTTEQLLFNGPPLVVPAGSTGQQTCFGITVSQSPAGSAALVGGIAYRFSA